MNHKYILTLLDHLTWSIKVLLWNYKHLNVIMWCYEHTRLSTFSIMFVSFIFGHVAAVWFDPVTFPFSPETVSRTSELSSLVRSCSYWGGLMCPHWLLRHCLNPQEFPEEGLSAKEGPTCPIKQNTPNHNVFFFPPTDCNTLFSQAETLRRKQRHKLDVLLYL